MKDRLDQRLEDGRLREGYYASATGDLHGAFKVIAPSGMELVIMSSGPDNLYGWEHVSVSLPHRTPNWAEMCWVKDQFWTPNECVMQLHPAQVDYVDHHPYCLHLWRPLRATIPTPPSLLVGPKAESQEARKAQ